MAQNKKPNRSGAAQSQRENMNRKAAARKKPQTTRQRATSQEKARPTRQEAAPQEKARSLKSQRAYFRRLRMEQQAQKEEALQERGLPMWGKTLVGVAVVLLLMLLLFRVRSFDVSGSTRYSAEEVMEASGITLGDVLMGVNKTKVASRILVKLPYVEQVEVSKSLPGTVSIQLVECEALVTAEAETGTKWLLNAQGKILERVDEESAYPLIQGALLQLPFAGDQAAFDDLTLGSQAMEIAAQVAAAGLSDSVRTIHVGEKNYLNYENRIQVELGDGTDIPYRLEYLKAALSRLTETARGTLDLSFSTGSQAIFHPLS